jgi:hypothetical protein
MRKRPESGEFTTEARRRRGKNGRGKMKNAKGKMKKARVDT